MLLPPSVVSFACASSTLRETVLRCPYTMLDKGCNYKDRIGKQPTHQAESLE
jgi:hypothetical protein